MNKLEKLQAKIKELHAIVDELNRTFPRNNGTKKFTLDGRLVGDIGEEIAAEIYGITLSEKQDKHYDGSKGDKPIQVKCTFKQHLTFKHCSKFYIGLKLYPDGSYQEVYNGPGRYIEDCYRSRRKHLGEKLLSFKITELAELSRDIPPEEKVLAVLPIGQYAP